MRRRTYALDLAVALLFAVNLSVGAVAGEISNGDIVQVKPNSIWFENADTLAGWQSLKKSGDQAALQSYQDSKLSERTAWQFTSQLAVRVISLAAESNQANVEMTSPGRLNGSAWFLDAEVLLK